MRKRLIGLVVVFVIAAGVATGAYQLLNASERPPAPAEEAMAEPGPRIAVIETASGDSHAFTVELAVTPQEMSKGLMNRDEMPENAGMLFLFPAKQPVAFWMKNTLIPLDMIFIDDDGTIKNIHVNAQPHSLDKIWSDGPVKSVLEINGGLSEKLGIAAGDTVVHPFFDNVPE